MRIWTGNIDVVSGQRMNICANVAGSGNFSLSVSATNPECVVVYAVTPSGMSTELTNDEFVQSLECVRVDQSTDGCETKIALTVQYDGQSTVTCEILDGDAEILHVDVVPE